ncbi:MAG: gliding motility-associated C-terminal domain-containing protein [Bacteroidia bacterium]|nr:gliding motility-associated C-terminal domain-containing protein [Bacteroidia bacterium]
MKPFYNLLAALFFCNLISAQTNINADCISAIPLCSTPNFTFNATSGVGNVPDIPNPSNISNPSTNPASTNAGCLLSGELKPQWLLITIGNAGNLEFIFGAGNSANPQVGFYDWAMWPYSPLTCANIQNNTLPPVRCNWNASSSGGTGIASAANQPSGSSAGNYEPPLAVLPCQQYIICISNYSGVNTLVSFQSVGTASLSCNPSCITVNNPSLCAGTSASIIAASSGNLANLTYSLNPGSLSSNTPTFLINPTTSGAYTVYATGLNSSSVAVTQTAVSNVTVYPKPLAAPSVTQSTCLNPTNGFDLGLGFSPSTPVPNYTVNWSSIPNGITSPTQTALTGTILPGVYTATITATGGCYTVTTFTINSSPTPASVSLTPSGPNYILNCYSPSVTISAANTSFNYTWTNGSAAPVNGPTGIFSNTGLGNWTITVINPASGCVGTKTISIGINTAVPVSAITPTFQNITCNLSSITTLTAQSSVSVNISHLITSPQGGTFSSNSYSTTYSPGSPGTYTYCLINDLNGCSSCKEFTVASNQGFPTFLVVSPQNFTLGCGTKSVATINITNGSTSLPPGGPVSYTILPPGASTVTPSGNLNVASSYTVNVPGTWTVITKDNTSFCETRVPVSILSNTFGPSIDTLIVPQTVLDCNTPSVTLEAISETPNTSYVWSYPAVPGNQPTSTITVNTRTGSATATLVANYTLTLTDNNNTCKTTTVVSILQNIFPPKATINNGVVPAITCKTNTVVLTNNSSTGILPGSQFPVSLPVVGYLWQGPSPQTPEQMSSTYLAATVGNYTLTALDLNNGCKSSTVIAVNDDRINPSVNVPSAPANFTLDCGATSVSIQPLVSGATANYNYSWLVPSGAATSGLTKQVLVTNKTGVYRVLVTNTVNGCASSGEVKVVNGILKGGFKPSTESGYAPLEVVFTNTSASSIDNSNITTVWHFGNGTYTVTKSADLTAQTNYLQSGTYTVTAFISKGECATTQSKIIMVEIPSKLEIPNVFTPNGDNVNDVFFLHANNLDQINMLIYDRWGHKIYELESNTGNILWDGKNQYGKEVPEGTYFYILKATGKDGNAFNTKGNISLFR